MPDPSTEEWTFEYFPLDVNPAELEPFSKIISTWQSRLKDNQLPKWLDFDMSDFQGWHRNLCLCDVMESGDDARYRIWGSGLAEIFGHDATGKLLSEAGLDYTDYERQQFRKFIKERKLVRCGGRLDWQNKHYKHITFLRLPLSEDGINIDRYIVLFRERNISAGADI